MFKLFRVGSLTYQKEKMKTNTAHEHWNKQWTTEEGRADWIQPEQFVIRAVEQMHANNINSVLDLGCGPGRHALYLAEEGFTVQALDAATTAIEQLNATSAARNLHINTFIGEMTDLHMISGSLDMLLAWNVIYHGDISVVQQSLSEITRVLRPGGLFIGTMLSNRNKEVHTGRKIAHGTYINEEKSDKNHPHFYCDASELLGLFSAFEPLLLEDVEHKHTGSGSYHWQFIMEKK